MWIVDSRLISAGYNDAICTAATGTDRVPDNGTNPFRGRGGGSKTSRETVELLHVIAGNISTWLLYFNSDKQLRTERARR